MDGGSSVSIEFVQSGGFGGLTLSTHAQAGDFDGAELAALKKAIHDPAHGDRGPLGPDSFQYDLTLIDGTQRRSVTFHEGRVPPELQGLIERLSGRAILQQS